MATLTIVFQPIGISGLGHTSRLIAVAQSVKGQRPDVRLPFLLEGTGNMLLERAGFPCLSLPIRGRRAGAEWQGWPAHERDGMIDDLAQCILERLKPHLVVFDTLPNPAIVAHVKKRKIPTVLCARKTKFGLESLRQQQVDWSMFDLIFSPHERGAMDVPPELRARFHFVGPIVRQAVGRPAPLSSEAGEKSHGSAKADGKLVVITAGGGGISGTAEFYNLVLTAFRSVRMLTPALEGILVTGPLFQQWDQLRPVEGITILPFDPDLGAKMQRADVVVCQGGYNTLAELSLMTTPAICLPAARPTDDQGERAHTLAARRRHFFVFTDSSADALKKEILECLALRSRPEPGEAAVPGGADRAARLILSLLGN